MVFTNITFTYRKKLLEQFPSLKQNLNEHPETFQERLMQLIWTKGFSETEIYKSANIDRRLFSKIRSDSSYHPQKQTILPLLIALHLNITEAEDLLSRAGFALSPTNTTDVIYRFCIQNKIFNQNMIDELIYELS